MPTSWERVQPTVDAWDLRATYDRAWEKFSDSIMDWTVSASDVATFTSQFDLTISTVPAWAICEKPNEHYFGSINILVQKDIDPAEFEMPADNWVIYNGTHEHTWYRACNIFGYTSIEARSDPQLVTNKKWEPGFKVVRTNCDCHPTVVKAGRMGKWTRGVLTHHAFEQTVEAIADQFGSLQDIT